MKSTTETQIRTIEQQAEYAAKYDTYLIPAEIASAVLDHLEAHHPTCNDDCSGHYVDYEVISNNLRESAGPAPDSPWKDICRSSVRSCVAEMVSMNLLVCHSNDKKGGYYCQIG